MKGESYLPKQGHHMAEPPHSKLKYAIVEHYSCRGGGKHCVNLASFPIFWQFQSWNTVSDEREGGKICGQMHLAVGAQYAGVVY